MKNDNFEDILKRKFESHTMTPPPSVMLNIERELAEIDSPSLNIQPKRKPNFLWGYVTAAASILIGVLLLNIDRDIDSNVLANADFEIEEKIYTSKTTQPSNATELISKNSIKPAIIRNIKNNDNKNIEPNITHQTKKVASPSQPIKIKEQKKSRKIEQKAEQKESIKSQEKRDSSNAIVNHSSSSPMPHKKEKKIFYTHISSSSLTSNSSNANNPSQLVPYTISGGKGDSEGYRTDITSPENLNHKIPISIGVHVGFNLTDRLSIESGLVYSKLNSSYETTKDSGIDFKFEQNLDYLGVPVSLRYNLLGHNLGSLYTKGGVMIERAISANRRSNVSREELYEKFSVKGVQTSLNLSLGGELKFLSKFGLFLEPGISYYFDNNQPDNYRTKNQFAFNLSAGLRFLIN